MKIYNKFSSRYSNTEFFLDLSESDDKNYHDSFRFTIFAKNVRGEIARGGRYISKNKDVEENATGFTFYMDTIIRASSKIQKTKKIIIPFETDLKVKNILIKKNYIIDSYFGDLRNIKKIAIKKNYQYCLFNNKIIKIN